MNYCKLLRASVRYTGSFLSLTGSMTVLADISAEGDSASVTAAADNIEVVEVLGVQQSLDVVKTERLLKVPGAGNDPLRALTSLPGVVFSSAQNPEPAIRGSSPEDNAYYVDFFPVGYLFHSDSTSIINDNIVEGFTLEAAAFGPQYNGSTGAVIDVTSRSVDFGNRQRVIDLSFLRAGFFIEQPTGDNQGFYLSGRQSLFQYYIENLLDDEDFQFTTIPEYYDYQGKYQIDLGANETLALNLIGARDKAGLVFDEDSDYVAQDPALSGGISFESIFNHQSLLWDKIHNNGVQQTIGLSQLERKMQFVLGTDSHIDIKVNDYTLRSQFSLPLGHEHQLQTGLEYGESHFAVNGQYAGPPCDEFQPDCRLVDGDEIISSQQRVTVREYNWHLADNWYVAEDWLLQPGALISVDNYTEEWFVEPKFNASWNVVPFWKLSAGYGRYHDFPDNFGQYAEDFGNPDLKLPTATHYELGVEHELREDLLVRLEGYYKTMQRIVVSRPSSANYPDLDTVEYSSLPRYFNGAEGQAWGMELFINKDLSNDWYGWASFAYSRTQRTNQLTGEDFRYAYDQPVVINLVAGYEMSDSLSFGLKWRFQSGQLITPLESVEQDQDDPTLYNPIYGDLNSERLPAYHSLDARMDKRFYVSGSELTLYVEALNLYAHRNVVGYEYKNADYSQREEVTDLPTIVALGLKIDL
ncbi:TonB-dependent receptor plug domain-containing protein [Oceanobacter mangrovi]|uniref:TonB-dependent receptor plug domain-containing protein n=1 Tax=Oceanobacter mangrovi TaxID=2862510 RepID=UPI001C8EAE4E|nr:TonB-dependent receptor [Oceanobacter mangrovi]